VKWPTRCYVQAYVLNSLQHGPAEMRGWPPTPNGTRRQLFRDYPDGAQRALSVLRQDLHPQRHHSPCRDAHLGA
jgi:hypothetical protein